MALTPMTFNPVTGLLDTAAYITGPASETDARQQVQGRLNELRDYLNNTLLAAIAAVTDGASGADNTGMTVITETGANATVQSVIEALITRIKAVTDSASGADLVGATAITGWTGATVQAILESAKTIVDAKFTTADASTTVKGIVELATDAEMATGTDTTRAITPANAKVELDKKALVTDFTTHQVDIVKHITSAERNYWNGKAGNLIYGVKINTTNSNPETALTYTDDAIGFTPATGNDGAFDAGSWGNIFPFNAIRPCLYKNGAVNYYLNPDNYAQKEDGVTASDIASGTDGDVMVEFPKIYWKFETIGTDLYVRFSDIKIDDTYKCLAHMRGITEKNYCYISAYLGYSLSSKLRSLSGKTPTGSQTIGAFRTLAQANGTGYDQMAFFQLLMLQVLFTVMFKSRDSQTALGRGYVDGNAAAIATGGTDAKGMFYGETTGKLQNKFCGIEDFWGNRYYWIDGMFSNATRNILIANQTFNNTGAGYTDYGIGAATNIEGYISAIQGETETGFMPKTVAGSLSTYYADYGGLYASCLPRFGGYGADADYAGAFGLDVDRSAADAYPIIGARLLAL